MGKPAMNFDILAYAKKLKKAGFNTKQAEGLSEALAGTIDNRVATKYDLKEQKKDLIYKIEEVDTRLTFEMKRLESRILIKLSSVMVVLFSVFGSFMALLFKVIH